MILLTPRPLYESQCHALMGSGQLIVITGQRRSGKSILLELLSQKYVTLAIDFELFTFDHLTTYTDLYHYISGQIKLLSGCTLVTIDEVQKIPQREKALLSLIKEYPHIQYIVTGSNSHLLASDLTTNLRGRYVQVHVLPFGLDEYCTYHTYSPSHESCALFLDQGGFPSTYILDHEKDKSRRSQTLIDTIFIKDIIERYAIRQPVVLRELFMYMVFNAGNLVNISSITGYLITKGVMTNRTTISDYLSYLTQAYMIYPVPVYDLSGKQVFDRIMKYYPSDHSWRKLLFGTFDPGMGKTLETMVYIECLRQGRDVRVGKIKVHEIDFVLSKGGTKIYIQVAYLLSSPDVIAREFDVLAKLSSSYPKYVISMDVVSLGNIDGIQHIRLWEMHKIFS